VTDAQGFWPISPDVAIEVKSDGDKGLALDFDAIIDA